MALTGPQFRRDNVDEETHAALQRAELEAAYRRELWGIEQRRKLAVTDVDRQLLEIEIANCVADAAHYGFDIAPAPEPDPDEEPPAELEEEPPAAGKPAARKGR